MAYIYKIINTVNNKVYIGKTERAVSIRFKEHCRASQRYDEDLGKRPLYSAMKKYGVDKFIVEEIEETDCPEERERYWIEYYGSFKTGYNATSGGDGRKYLDYDVLIETYKQTLSIKETAEICGCDERYLSEILKSHNVQIRTQQEYFQQVKGKLVNQYTLAGEYLSTYPSLREAARAIGKDEGASHINNVCKGKRKTAYGYIWKYSE